jgi:hypothetical protein
MTRLPNSGPSSKSCVADEILLRGSRRLAALLILHGLGLPLALLLSGLRHSGWAALAAAGLALASGAGVARLCLGRGDRAPRRLRFTPEGEMHLDLAGGFTEPVTLRGSSTVRGPWRVLQLQGRRERYRVLIDANEVAPPALAALGRCLARLAVAPAAPRGALTSAVTGLIEPGRSGS